MWKLLKELLVVAVKLNLDRTLKETLDQVLKTRLNQHTEILIYVKLVHH